MTALIVVALLLGGASALILVRIAYRPFRNIPLNGLALYLEMLLKRGHNGAFVIISEMRTKRFVQFQKYIRPGRRIGLELSIPNAPWARPYYESLKKFLARQGIEFVRTPVNSEPTTEFVDVDCGADLDLAVRLVEAIFLEVFGLQRSALFRVNTSKVSARDEIVDR